MTSTASTTGAFNRLRSITPALIESVADQGIVVIRDFIDADVRTALRTDIGSTAMTPAGIGRASALQRNEAIRGDSIAWLDGSTLIQQQYLALMEQLRLTINQQLFLGLFDYECHYACYAPKQFYRKHRDAFANSERQLHSRVLTTICYLNEQWQPDDGGELLVYGDDDSQLLRVDPLPGTLVVFLAERFPHEVLATTVSRYSITGWFRRS